ncbi:MAG: diguanylate cyclase, partial [Gammaproteobacteria bacterium]|nr:diguanylate cyclase [Gammaproteobacteria bacterium]
MGSHHKQSILLVDDHPENIITLAEVLGDHYSAQVATDGTTALELAQRQPQPDLILLDVMMPEMDGYEVCRLLKANPFTCTIPVIFITALTESESEVKGLHVGAVDYIHKPINPNVTLSRIKAHLDLNRAIRDLDKSNQQLQKYYVAIDNSPSLIVITDNQGVVEYANPKAAKITGYDSEELEGESILNLRKEENNPTFIKMCQEVSSGREWRGVIQCHRKDGTPYWAKAFIGPIFSNDKEIVNYVAIIEDVSTEHQTNRKNSYHASHDLLTGLLNRREYRIRLEKFFASPTRHQNQHILLFLDLDHFKPVNDRCGHSAGDRLLRTICEKITQQVRQRDTVARIGGDEFAVILENCDQEMALLTAEKIREAVESVSFRCNDENHDVTVSIGLTVVNAEVETIEALEQQADIACYLAKA